MSIATKHSYRFGYLKSEEWQNVRAEVLARFNARCLVCGKRDLANDVHHRYYRANIWHTRALDCVVLCRTCHNKVHQRFKGRTEWKHYRILIRELKALTKCQRVNERAASAPLGVKSDAERQSATVT